MILRFSFLIVQLFSLNLYAFEIHGHRGARGNFPENSLSAIEFALDSNIDSIEIDVVISKDHQIVVTHDLYTNPDLCVYNDGAPLETIYPIYDLTYDELKSLDCGSVFQKKFANQTLIPSKMPTLEDIYDLFHNHENGLKTRLNIELKYDPKNPLWAPERNAYAALVSESIINSGLPRVMVQSFDHELLLELRKLLPEITISVLNTYPSKNLVRIAQEIKATYITPNYRFLTKSRVRFFQDCGFKVLTWTANSTKIWNQLIYKGIDGIITDYPEDLRVYKETPQKVSLRDGIEKLPLIGWIFRNI